jgi:hypothetical protein
VCALTLFVAVALAAQSPGGSDALPRRAWFGVALAPHEKGAAVTSVADGSSAAAAGIRAGDVFAAVDDQPIRMPNEVVAAIAGRVSGEIATIDYRGGRTERRSIALRPSPRDTLAGVTFDYGSVAVATTGFERSCRFPIAVMELDGFRAALAALKRHPARGGSAVNAALVNAQHPGRATHRELAGLDHCWTRHVSMVKSRGNCGSGEAVPALSDAVLGFLATA